MVNAQPITGADQALPSPSLLQNKRAIGDKVFRNLCLVSGSVVLLIIVAISSFLIIRALPALRDNEQNFFIFEQWLPDDATSPEFGIAALAFGTVLSSTLAVLISVPIALGVALFISHYAPRKLAWILTFLVDLLAAVPSIVFGLWGREVFSEPVIELSRWLNKNFSWIPIFASDGRFGASILLGALVLAIMILPIIASLSREVFLQTPRLQEEAAIALGATRWETIRTSVLPYARGGIIAAVMLGLGRALGETIALALVLSSTFTISWHILEPGGNTIAANIANQFAEAGSTGVGALIASGLVLFAITLIVNMIARVVLARSRFSQGASS